MQITTTKAVELLNIFSQFTGYPQAVELQGKTQVIIVPYDIGPKAQWNLVKNRNILRPIKDMSDELVAEKRKLLQQFMTTLDLTAPVGVNDKKFDERQAQIDADQKVHFDELHEVNGLLKIPAADIRIRRTDTTLQNVLEALMGEGFLDGEPDVGDKPKTQ
jgi:hypothetical protein